MWQLLGLIPLSLIHINILKYQNISTDLNYQGSYKVTSCVYYLTYIIFELLKH